MGVDALQHRFQPSEMAQLAADDVPRLKLKWAFGYPAATIAFAQPTIVAGRLFVGSQSAKSIRSMRGAVVRFGSCAASTAFATRHSPAGHTIMSSTLTGT
jgi:hypothetical protein